MRIILAAVVALCVLAGCEQPDQSGTGLPQTALETVPADLEELDPPVREQFRQLQTEALRARAEADPEAAAEAVGRLGMWHQVYYAWDPETAFTLYAEAARLDPSDPRWPFYSGFTAVKLGRLEAARTAFERALQLDPDDVAALVHLAEIDLRENAPASARERLARARRLQPDSARIIGGLGDAAFQEGDYHQAISYFQEALELFPQAPQLNYKLALAHQRLGNEETAKQLFARTPHSQQVLDFAFKNPYQKALVDMNVGSLARVSSARQAMASGDHEKAAELAQEAVATAASRKTPLLNLASVYLQSGKPAATVETVNTIEHEFGPLPAALILRALAHERSGNLSPALHDYRAVVADEPGNLQALIGAGEVARRLGDLEQALAFYDQGVRHNPGEIAPRLMRARALWHLGRVEELRRTLAGDVSIHPDSAWLLALRGRMSVIADEPEEIHRGLEASVAAYGSQPSVFSAQSIAMGLAGLGRFEDAVVWQQLAASSLFSGANSRLYQLAQQRLQRIRSGQLRWPAALDDFDTLNAPLDNPPPPPVP